MHTDYSGWGQGDWGQDLFRQEPAPGWPKPGNLEGPHVFIMATRFFLCQTCEWFNGKNMGMLDPDHTTYNIQNFIIILTLIEGFVSTKKIWSVVSLGFFLGCFFPENICFCHSFVGTDKFDLFRSGVKDIFRWIW